MTGTLLLMQGAPGSGKSTRSRVIAEGRDAVIYATDDYWYRNSDTYVFDPEKIGEAHAWNQHRVRLAMVGGVSLIIVDNTNVLRRYAQPYEELAGQYGYTVSYERIDPGLEECFRRNLLREKDRKIPEDVVRDLYAKMEWLGTDENDPRCSNCHIPLRAVTRVRDGRCGDEEACDARRVGLIEHGGATLISPEGITRIVP